MLGFIIGVLLSVTVLQTVLLYKGYNSTPAKTNTIVEEPQVSEEHKELEKKLIEIQEKAIEDFNAMLNYNEDIAYKRKKGVDE